MPEKADNVIEMAGAAHAPPPHPYERNYNSRILEIIQQIGYKHVSVGEIFRHAPATRGPINRMLLWFGHDLPYGPRMIDVRAALYILENEGCIIFEYKGMERVVTATGYPRP